MIKTLGIGRQLTVLTGFKPTVEVHYRYANNLMKLDSLWRPLGKSTHRSQMDIDLVSVLISQSCNDRKVGIRLAVFRTEPGSQYGRSWDVSAYRFGWRISNVEKECELRLKLS
jgi:hypothetical protein